MAEARVETREVEKVVKEQVEEFILVLSRDEAQTLRDLIGGAVHGSIVVSRHRFTHSIWGALCRAGLTQHSEMDDYTGFVEFKSN